MDVWTKISVIEEVKMERPILIQGLPGLGFVGKIAVDYLVDTLKPPRSAELYSTYLVLPDGNTGIQVNSDGTYFLPKFEFYAYTATQPHIIFLTGNTQPVLWGQYEVMDAILEFAQKHGASKVIALGGFQTPIEKDIGQVYAVYNDTKIKDELSNFGVNVTKSGAITGACGMILGLAHQRKLPSIGLLGATKGEYPDLAAARGVVKVLMQMFGLKVDLAKMDLEIEDMKTKMENLRNIQVEAYKRAKEMEKRPFYV